MSDQSSERLRALVLSAYSSRMKGDRDMSVMVDPYKVEVRVFHPELMRVEFLEMEGHNKGQCINRAADKYPGWVATAADRQVELGEVDEHYWANEGSCCVKCGGLEWMMPDSDCSGVYGVY